MNPLTPFIVLIERRRLRRALALTLATLVLFAGALSVRTGHAATVLSNKIAADLQQVIAAPTTPKLSRCFHKYEHVYT